MRALWLVFTQAVTIAVGVVFVLATLRPDLLPLAGRGSITIAGSEPPSVQSALAVAPTVGSFRDAARKAMASVVNIFTSKDIKVPRHPLMSDPFLKRFFGDQLDDEPQRASSLGSGVIVGADGFLLTNHHVIEAADEIEVALTDGRKLSAKLVGTDPETDLAVLHVRSDKLPAVTFGSVDNVRVGDVVLAVGNHFE